MRGCHRDALEICLSGLDRMCVPLNTTSMSVTPDAIRQLLDELEANRRSRRTAWATLQRLRKFLETTGARISIPVFLTIATLKPKARPSSRDSGARSRDEIR